MTPINENFSTHTSLLYTRNVITLQYANYNATIKCLNLPVLNTLLQAVSYVDVVYKIHSLPLVSLEPFARFVFETYVCLQDQFRTNHRSCVERFGPARGCEHQSPITFRNGLVHSQII
jgi:hypothetical protein